MFLPRRGCSQQTKVMLYALWENPYKTQICDGIGAPNIWNTRLPQCKGERFSLEIDTSPEHLFTTASRNMVQSTGSPRSPVWMKRPDTLLRDNSSGSQAWLSWRGDTAGVTKNVQNRELMFTVGGKAHNSDSMKIMGGLRHLKIQRSVGATSGNTPLLCPTTIEKWQAPYEYSLPVALFLMYPKEVYPKWSETSSGSSIMLGTQ